jgi:hypothetical protein
MAFQVFHDKHSTPSLQTSQMILIIRDYNFHSNTDSNINFDAFKIMSFIL